MSWIDKFQDGCTGVSWIASWFGHVIDAEECCRDHDRDYAFGGSLLDKFQSDWRLTKCLYNDSQKKTIGALRAGGALLITTFLPYAYVVWKKK